MSHRARIVEGVRKHPLWVCVVVFVAALICGWLAINRNRAHVTSELPAASGTADAISGSTSLGTVALPAVKPGASEPIDERGSSELLSPPAPDERLALTIQALWSRDGSPAAGIHMIAYMLGDGVVPLGERVGVADENGIWRVPRVVRGTVVVLGDRGGSIKTKGSLQDQLVTLEIPVGIAVRGKVIDVAGAPVGDAHVLLSREWLPSEYDIVGKSNAAGEFAVQDVSPNRYIGACHCASAPSPMLLVEGGASAMVQVTLQVGASSGTVYGRVSVAGTGEAVRNGTVRIGGEDGWTVPDIIDRVRQVGPQPITMITDADGRFEACGVPIGPASIDIRGQGYAPRLNGSLTIPARGRVDASCELTMGGRVRGHISRVDGGPIDDATVIAGEFSSFGGNPGSVTDTGDYELTDLPAGEANVQVIMNGGLVASTTVSVVAGKSVEWDPIIGATGGIWGVVSDKQSGNPLPGVCVCASRTDGTEIIPVNAVSDSNGWFMLYGCIEGERYTVVVRRCATEEGAAQMPMAVVQDVTATRESIRIEVTDEQAASGGVAIRVLDSAGQVLNELRILLLSPETGRRIKAVQSDMTSGVYMVSSLPLGSYVCVGYISSELVWVGNVQVDRDGIVVQREVTVAPPGWVDCGCASQLEAGRSCVMSASCSGQEVGHHIVDASDGATWSWQLPVGSYDIRMTRPGIDNQDRSIEVYSGVHARFECD